MSQEVNEIGAWLYTYNVSNGNLELVEKLPMAPENETKFEDHYLDSSKFIADYKAGELKFYESPQTTPDEIFKKIEAKKKETNVELLLKSDLMNGQPQPDLNAPAPSEPNMPVNPTIPTPTPEPAASAAPKLPGDYVRMKKDGNIDMIHVTEFEKAVADGWVPTKKEYRDYPIVLDPATNKIKFTCYEPETEKYANEGMVIIRFAQPTAPAADAPATEA